MRRLLRIRPDLRPAAQRDVHRVFSISILLSAARCLLSYVVFPVVLPSLGVAAGIGPAIGIPVGILALVFDVRGIRRFWIVNHRSRWAITFLYLAVMVMVASLVIVELVRALR